MFDEAPLQVPAATGLDGSVHQTLQHKKYENQETERRSEQPRVKSALHHNLHSDANQQAQGNTWDVGSRGLVPPRMIFAPSRK